MENVTMTPTQNTPGVVVSEKGHSYGHEGFLGKDLTAILTPFLVSDIKNNAIVLTEHVKDSHIAIERLRGDTLTATKETNILVAEHAHRTRELIREMFAENTKAELAQANAKLLAIGASKAAPAIAV